MNKEINKCVCWSKLALIKLALVVICQEELIYVLEKKYKLGGVWSGLNIPFFLECIRRLDKYYKVR